MLIGIIIARKGSKRIKNKNIRKLKNKPLYSWSIKTLKIVCYLKKLLFQQITHLYQKCTIIWR